MKIHEYQGKDILRKFNVPVPEGSVAHVVERTTGIDKGGDAKLHPLLPYGKFLEIPANLRISEHRYRTYESVLLIAPD